MVMAEKKKGRPSRFRWPKSASEEQVLAEEAVPSSTKYNNKLALKIFREWQQQREMKVSILDPGGLFKDFELHEVNPVSCETQDMDAISLNYWLTKFVMEVAKDSGERYPHASSLFNAGVEEKLIRERTGHRSNALLKYEKPSEEFENKGKVSYLLGPNAVLSSSKGETCKQEDEKPLTSLFNAAFHEGTFQNCNFHVVNNFSVYGGE